MPKASKKTKESKPAGSPFLKYFLALIVVLAMLNAGGGYWAYQRGVVAAEQQALNALSQDQAVQQAGTVEKYLNDVKARLRNFARREAASKSLAEDNPAMLQTLTNSLQNELPDVRGIRLFKAGSAQLDRGADTPIRFAELDMINRAEKRETVLPEAARVDDEWRINLVEALPFAGPEQAAAPVIGVVFVSIGLADLRATLGAADQSRGRTTLMQQYGQRQPQTLAQLGEGGAGEAQEVAIANSYWLVSFTPSDALATQARVNPAGIFALQAVAALASLVFAYLLARNLSGKTAGRREKLDQAAQAEANFRYDDSVMDLKVSREDSDLVSMAAEKEEEDPLDIRDANPAPPTKQTSVDIPAEIFRSYDIRGLVASQLTPTNVVLIGRSIGSQTLAAGESTLVVGRDGRTHSADIAEQLIEGILATGCDVVNIGMVPTPMVYFACSELDKTNSAVMVTASHNPPEYNGFKIVINGDTLKDAQIQHLRARLLQGDFAKGAGKEDFADYSFPYIDRIFSDVALAGEISVVIDAGNGAAGEIAPRLFNELGCQVTPLFCAVDGTFPNHPPDPSVAANLEALIEKVREVGADLGIALDGDGDRVGIVTASGQIIQSDRLLMLLAKDIVSRNPGADVLFDVKCSRELNNVISSYGGRPIMWKAGHSHMKAKMKETGALLGGELSGHIFIKERWYGFDDGLYAAARIIEIMSLREQDLDSIFENFPSLPATPEIKVAVDESKKFAIVKRLIEQADFGQGRTTIIDGLRVDFPEGWGLVRASNTSAALTLRFEGKTEAVLAEIQARFKKELLKVEPGLTLGF
ncbi:MAG: phosphomannomutase/phosphoglucomutase [Cellvibrionaceae bacterium]